MTIITTDFPTDAELDARVAKGAALFDARRPDWAHGVARELLDMYSTRYCVAAQVIFCSDSDDAYQDAMEELGITYGDQAVEHGFSLSWREVRDAPHASSAPLVELFVPLTAAWLRAIDARLAAR